jgi:hypothetical protein
MEEQRLVSINALLGWADKRRHLRLLRCQPPVWLSNYERSGAAVCSLGNN